MLQQLLGTSGAMAEGRAVRDVDSEAFFVLRGFRLLGYLREPLRNGAATMHVCQAQRAPGRSRGQRGRGRGVQRNAWQKGAGFRAVVVLGGHALG